MEGLFDFDDLFEDILGLQEYVKRRVNIKRNLPKRIATVLDAERASELFLQFIRGEISETVFDEGLEGCVVEYGMTKEEIEQYFPPDPRHKDKLSFNRTSLIASIIWEERELVGTNRRPGNVRHFWYTNLMYTLMKVLGDTSITNINTTYQKVLADLVKYEKFRYSELNLTSNKGELCEALFKDSPYPNVIIACEKESYHDHLKRLASIFQITFISLGGQGSYKVYEDLVVDFINAGIDINSEFHIFTISDFDPQGYSIQDTAKEHLQRAGIRKVTIHRVYLCPEHITRGIVKRHAVPYVWRKKSSQGNKAALTLYNKFGERTGGIYKHGDEWQRFSQNGDGSYSVPILADWADGYELYRVELDNFQDEVLLQLLIDALADFMDGSEYYYKRAQDYVDSLFQERAEELANGMIEQKTRDAFSEEFLLSQELEQEIAEKSEEMVAEDREFFQSIEDNYQRHYQGIEDEISRLQDELNDLITLHWDIEKFRREIEKVKARKVIDIHEEYKDTISSKLDSVLADAQNRLCDTIQNQLSESGFPVKEWVDFSDHNNDIFEVARSGAKTFDAELSYGHKSDLNLELRDELDRRKEEILPMIQLPEPPEDITDISIHAENIRAELESVTAGQLSDELLRKMRVLKRVFMNLNITDEFWEGNDNLNAAIEYITDYYYAEDDDE